MDSIESPRESSPEIRRVHWDWLAAAALFAGTAAVVVWQNSRLAVLWDLSYILENSYRISLGDVPYREFPLPYAPGTFLIQALLIRLSGRAFFHHIAYCAIAGGLATLLTWRILIYLLEGAVASFRLVAFLLSIPLTVLGIYSVFPHPFYDPDCTFAILCAVLLLLQLERKRFPPIRAFLTGIVSVIPLFVKQNTGLAFLAAVGVAFAILIAIEAWRGRSVDYAAWLLAGMACGLILAILLLHLTVGVGNYVHWTMQFAASRRLPRFSDMRSAFANPILLLWLAFFLAGAFLFSRNWPYRKFLSRLAAALMAAPFVWAILYLLVDDDPAERAEQLLTLWPLILILSLVFAARNFWPGPGISNLLPIILVGTVLGAFLSQQLWGSTYAIWPLLIILFAGILVELHKLRGARRSRELEWLAGVVAVSLSISGGFYVASHERLNYADLMSGELSHSTLPALAGLSARGFWIPQFEELVHFSDREIPRDQGLLIIPGEDLFYYSTGRHPQFPVLLFDRTVNPYSPAQIVELAHRRNICWLIVKKKLQLNDEPVEDKDRLLELLQRDFAPHQDLTNYAIYKRKPGSACEDISKSRQNEN